MSILIPDGTALVSPQALAEYTAGTKTGTKHQALVVCDSAGNPVDSLAAAPAGTERGIVTRPIASGTQVVAGGSAAGAALSGNPVRNGASDGTNIQDLNVTAKGTQGARGLAVQDLKDAGRTPVLIHAEAAAGNAADTLLTLVKVTGSTTAAGATSISPTTGKTLRITEGVVVLVSTGTAVINVRFRGRYNPTGAALLTSAVQAMNFRHGFLTAPVSGSVLAPFSMDMTEGFEVPSGGGFGVSHIGSANSYTVDVMLFGYEF